ncbi:MAG: hypothetical protein WCO84_02905 [bacterium]
MTTEKYAEYEEKVRQIKNLQKRIANPEDDRLLKDHLRLQSELEAALSDPKTKLFVTFKKITISGRFYQTKDEQVVLFQGNRSMTGNPELNYFLKNGAMTCTITTAQDFLSEEITKEVALDKLMSGQGFMKD